MTARAAGAGEPVGRRRRPDSGRGGGGVLPARAAPVPGAPGREPHGGPLRSGAGETVPRGRAPRIEMPAPAPRYELRLRRRGPADTEYEIRQLPAPATPHVRKPIRVAGLRGRNLELVEHRVLRRLAQAGVRPARRAAPRNRGYPLAEDLALTLGLLFRALAPMRSRDHMRAVAEGIEAMEREEAAYWLGMAMHRRRPRRVLTALRVLLTEPAGKRGRA